jgi:cytochrome c-type biogenesis protein
VGRTLLRIRRLSPTQIALLAAGVIVIGLILFALLAGGSSDSAAEASVGLSETPFPILAALAFVAGMLGFVSPCTLPLLPAYFAVTFQSDRKRVLVMTAAFMGGLALAFAVFGALAGILGQLLGEFGLSRYDLGRAGGVLVLIFGVMSLLGKGFSGLRSTSKREASVWGSFGFGATFGIGFTSCTGPVLGAISTLAVNANFAFMGGQVAQLAPILGSMLLLIVFAMGLGVPLIVVSTFFGRSDRNGLFWRVLRGKGWQVTVLGRRLYLHSANIISGLLFVTLGIMMMTGRLTLLNSLVPDDLALWAAAFFANLEEWLISRLGG